MPCKHTSYKVSLESFLKNTIEIYTDGPIENKTFTFNYFYDTLNTEQRIESLDYDFGSFLVNAGGNLGLFLGLSCLSILLYCVKCLEMFIAGLVSQQFIPPMPLWQN